MAKPPYVIHARRKRWAERFPPHVVAVLLGVGVLAMSFVILVTSQ